MSKWEIIKFYLIQNKLRFLLVILGWYMDRAVENPTYSLLGNTYSHLMEVHNHYFRIWLISHYCLYALRWKEPQIFAYEWSRIVWCGKMQVCVWTLDWQFGISCSHISITYAYGEYRFLVFLLLSIGICIIKIQFIYWAKYF